MRCSSTRALLAQDQQAGGIPVEPVGKLQELGLRPGGAHRLDHPVAHSAAAVDRDTARLVHDQDRGVFILDGQVERLCPGFGFRAEPHRGNSHPVPDLEAVVGFDAPAIHPDFPAAQHPVNVALRHALQLAQQEVVDALGLAFLADFQRPYLGPSRGPSRGPRSGLA